MYEARCDEPGLAGVGCLLGNAVVLTLDHRRLARVDLPPGAGSDQQEWEVDQSLRDQCIQSEVQARRSIDTCTIHGYHYEGR